MLQHNTKCFNTILVTNSKLPKNVPFFLFKPHKSPTYKSRHEQFKLLGHRTRIIYDC